MDISNIYKYKSYVHFDDKKDFYKYHHLISNPKWIIEHGFYPFIHRTVVFNKFAYNNCIQKKEKVSKPRDIYYSAHIDRYVYQYYAYLYNKLFNEVSIKNGTNKVATAYRSNFKGKSNIHFSKEALEFIAKNKSVFIFVSDFNKFFDNLDHLYLKSKLEYLLNTDRLPLDHYKVFKSITNFSYINERSIEEAKDKKCREMRNLTKYFDPDEFRNFKNTGNNLSTNRKSYGIPQGSSISAVYSNIYMLDFDKNINNYVTSNKGLYRRYCDDIIIIIPMEEQDMLSGEYTKHIDIINHIMNSTDRVSMNPDKTEYYFYNSLYEQKLMNLNGPNNILNYLGFSFDGRTIRIREKSLFKFYSRAYKKAKVVNNNKGLQSEFAIKKSLYKTYTHIGDKKYSKKSGTKNKSYGNFITYARKSKEIFDTSKYLDNEINNQIKRHWTKINKRLNVMD